MKKLITIIFVLAAHVSFSQSADSKICNCRAEPVSADFMNAATVKIAGISSPLIPESTLRPGEPQSVNFQVPKMKSKPGCTSQFTMAIFDDSTNAKIFETTSTNNSFSYIFKSCTKKYRVTLSSFTGSGGGNDGNCRRSITCYVVPKCATQQCNCFATSTKAGKIPVSADLNLDATLVCRTPTSTQRSYVLRYTITNKTTCNLKVESIMVHGQTVSLPVFNIAPKGRSASLTEVVTTAAAVAAPSGSLVRATVRYSLNGKKCSSSMDIANETCK